MSASLQVNFAHFEFNPAQDLLGEGPLSEVYKAVDRNLERTVALKILRPHAEIDPEADTRFAREAKHTSRLDHTNIATIYEYGEDSGRAFIAMEYCEGRTLDRIIKDKALGIEESMRIGLQLTSALALVHRSGLIHRDLKPANIMVQNDGTVKLLDFGICRATGEQTITQHGMLVGTVLYMSPEQVRGDDLDSRSDIFSMGAVLYNAMCGILPFPGESFPEVCMAILDLDPPPLSLLRSGFPKPLESFVMKCLDRDADKRYPNAEVAHGALLAIADAMSMGNGVVRGKDLKGFLAIPPLRLSGETDLGRAIAAGVRADLRTELDRSTGIEVDLLEDTSAIHDLTRGFVVTGTLNIEGALGVLDMVLEQCPIRNGAESRAIWHERIEHKDRDEWGLQAQLVRSAARIVKRRLSEYSLKPVEQTHTRDTRLATELSVRARNVLHRGMTKHLLASVSLFRQAIEADPYASLGYAGMAEALVRKFLYWDGDRSFLTEARNNARRALALDPGCAEAHTALGFEYHMNGHMVDAQREYRLAIQQSKEEWLAHRLLGTALSRHGNLKEASPLLQRAIALRPTYISSYDHLHTVLQRLDRYEEALEIADRGIAAARKHLRTVPDDQDARVHLAMLLARMGLREESMETLEAALERAPKDGFTSFHCACVHTLLGNLTEAMEALLAAQGRGYFIKLEMRNPELDLLRGLPEFQALAQ